MVKVRLRRMGARNAPFYRVVVSDSRRFPSSSAIEELGYYDPRVKPPRILIQEDRVEHWVSQGAQLSPTVKRLLGKNNVDVGVAVAEAPAAEAEAPAAEEAAAEEAPAEEATAEEAPAEEAPAEEAPAEGAEA